MIPDGETFNVRERVTYYRDGNIVTEYTVLVPDSTISDDYRHEHVMTSKRIEWRPK